MGDVLKDYTDIRFGKIVIHWPVGYVGNKPRACWLALCDCGKLFVVRASNLSGDRTQSCGCARKEQLIKRNFKHGHAVRGQPTPEYQAWANMIQRCSDLEDPSYGGRGIKVCDRWINSFEVFFEDMGSKPKGMHGLRAEYSIDRENVNGNYEPGNCRWATVEQQSRNKRRTVHEDVSNF